MATINKGSILEEISRQLDISPTMYKTAVDRYTAVAEYLQRKGLNANFYPQGSFRLGTVTRPVKMGVECDYDIDLVCQVLIPKNSTSPSSLKNGVGDLLKDNTKYNEILDEEGRRCWTLNYAEKDGLGFHLDILPSVGENTDNISGLISTYGIPHDYAKHLIAITEKKKDMYSWVSSNPAGYATWFSSINQPFYELIEKSARQQIFENYQQVFASIEDVPSQLIRTPLQRVVQILKRHRDIRFSGHEFEADKPISMILTTLTAMIVKNENCITLDIFTLLDFVVSRLLEYAALIDNPTKQIQNTLIRRDLNNNKWYIPNPVNPDENFADRWHENGNRKAKAFFEWIKWVSSDLIANLNNENLDISSMKYYFGNSVVEKANEKYKLKHLSTEINNKQSSPVHISNPTKPWRI
jgi:hypothetical protein